MKLFERFQGLMASSYKSSDKDKDDEFTINLICELQDDGHMFISSPELKGFTLMLDPEHMKNMSTLMSAIHDPLIAYVADFCHARDNARAERTRLEIKNWGKKAPLSYQVQLSPC